jgi:hypothetical protein
LSGYELRHVYESATYFGLSLNDVGTSVATMGLIKSPASIFRMRMASTPMGRSGYANDMTSKAENSRQTGYNRGWPRSDAYQC